MNKPFRAGMWNRFTARCSQKIWLATAPSAGFLVFIAALPIHPYRLICNASLIPLSGGCQDKNTRGLCTLSSETQQRWEWYERSRSTGNYPQLVPFGNHPLWGRHWCAIAEVGAASFKHFGKELLASLNKMLIPGSLRASAGKQIATFFSPALHGTSNIIAAANKRHFYSSLVGVGGNGTFRSNLAEPCLHVSPPTCRKVHFCRAMLLASVFPLCFTTAVSFPDPCFHVSYSGAEDPFSWTSSFWCWVVKPEIRAAAVCQFGSSLKFFWQQPGSPLYLWPAIWNCFMKHTTKIWGFSLLFSL